MQAPPDGSDVDDFESLHGAGVGVDGSAIVAYTGIAAPPALLDVAERQKVEAAVAAVRRAGLQQLQMLRVAGPTMDAASKEFVEMAQRVLTAHAEAQEELLATVKALPDPQTRDQILPLALSSQREAAEGQLRLLQELCGRGTAFDSAAFIGIIEEATKRVSSMAMTQLIFQTEQG